MRQIDCSVQAYPGEVPGEVKNKLSYIYYGPAKLRRETLVPTGDKRPKWRKWFLSLGLQAKEEEQ
jgi:hypothetical protein